MEEKTKIDSLFIHVREYVEERIKLINLNIYDKASKTVSGAALTLIIMLLGVFVLLFLSIALSWWIGIGLLNAPYLGFLIVGGVYLLITIIVYVNREKWIALPVTNSFLKNIADEEN